jgi:hypothetical protein
MSSVDLETGHQELRVEGSGTNLDAGTPPGYRLSWVVNFWEDVVDWYSRQIPHKTDTQVFIHLICLLVG